MFRKIYNNNRHIGTHVHALYSFSLLFVAHKASPIGCTVQPFDQSDQSIDTGECVGRIVSGTQWNQRSRCCRGDGIGLKLYHSHYARPQSQLSHHDTTLLPFNLLGRFMVVRKQDCVVCSSRTTLCFGNEGGGVFGRIVSWIQSRGGRIWISKETQGDCSIASKDWCQHDWRSWCGHGGGRTSHYERRRTSASSRSSCRKSSCGERRRNEVTLRVIHCNRNHCNVYSIQAWFLSIRLAYVNNRWSARAMHTFHEQRRRQAGDTAP